MGHPAEAYTFKALHLRADSTNFEVILLIDRSAAAGGRRAFQRQIPRTIERGQLNGAAQEYLSIFT